MVSALDSGDDAEEHMYVVSGRISCCDASVHTV